jgi:hypothetical protein
MSWKVKAHAWNAKGRRFKVVIVAEEWDDEARHSLDYWIRNMDSTDKITIRRSE